MGDERGWYSRGYLPHLDAPGRTQFVTWRLADSVPSDVIQQWRKQLSHLPDGERHKELYSRIEKHMDAGHGSCILRNPVAALAVQDRLISMQGDHYRLIAWTVMPNHVHVLFAPSPCHSLGTIVADWKGATSRQIHRALGGSGSLWQRDYFDRMIRDDEHLQKVRKYIEWNAVKAGLCSDPKHWPFSSSNPDVLKKALSACHIPAC